jgi:hypothetical protein
VKVAYADPPYVGQAKRHYANEPEYAGEVDHQALIARLMAEYPDGWALSCSSTSLRLLLPMCPADVRVLAWVKPWCIWKDRSVAYAWEPVIIRGGRRRTRDQLTVRDWLACSPPAKGRFAGAKPEAFCIWLFEVLGLQAGDTLDDLYPGTGAVGRAWQKYQGQMVLSA